MENNTSIQNKSEDIITENNEKKQVVNENVSEIAVEKIKKQAECASGQNVPAVAIYNYLINKCNTDNEFSALVIVEGKTLAKCFSYVTERAFEKAAMQNITADTNSPTPIGIGMSGDEIFVLVDEYFSLDDKTIEERKTAERKAIEEARKAADELKRAAEKEKKQADNKKKKPADAKKEVKKPAEKPVAVEDNSPQMSLFD